MNFRPIIVALTAGMIASSALHGGEKLPGRGRAGAQGSGASKAPAIRKAQPIEKAPKAGTTPANSAPKPAPLDRLRNMSPQDRDRFLAKVPPERREKLERRLGELQKMPPAMVDRLRTRQELLNSFPPPRQNQIKRSVQQFLVIPDERRALLNQEIQRMAPLPNEERRAYMNTEEFRNRFTAGEQQMMGNLVAITPGPAQP